jgi:hypothetical protein
MQAKENIHYVDNQQFSQAVVDYVTELNEAKKNNQEPLPIVTDYIAICFLKIAEGLSHKANFIRYTYREEMVMDAVENCLKAIDNYDLSVATRTGKPNAFAYFTQISWYAFLRRIIKEKKQQDIKVKFVAESGFEEFFNSEGVDGDDHNQIMQSFVDTLKERIDNVKDKDKAVKDYAKQERKRGKSASSIDSDLEDFM